MCLIFSCFTRYQISSKDLLCSPSIIRRIFVVFFSHNLLICQSLWDILTNGKKITNISIILCNIDCLAMRIINLPKLHWYAGFLTINELAFWRLTKLKIILNIKKITYLAVLEINFANKKIAWRFTKNKLICAFWTTYQFSRFPWKRFCWKKSK